MKYIRLFNESIGDVINIGLLLDVFKDFEDEYNTIKIEYPKIDSYKDKMKSAVLLALHHINLSQGYVKITRGNEIIDKDKFDNTIKRALQYYYDETGDEIYIAIIKIHYNAFFDKISKNLQFILNFSRKVQLRFKDADIVLFLSSDRIVDEFNKYKIFSR